MRKQRHSSESPPGVYMIVPPQSGRGCVHPWFSRRLGLSIALPMFGAAVRQKTPTQSNTLAGGMCWIGCAWVAYTCARTSALRLVLTTRAAGTSGASGVPSGVSSGAASHAESRRGLSVSAHMAWQNVPWNGSAATAHAGLQYETAWQPLGHGVPEFPQ